MLHGWFSGYEYKFVFQLFILTVLNLCNNSPERKQQNTDRKQSQEKDSSTDSYSRNRESFPFFISWVTIYVTQTDDSQDNGRDGQ